MYSDTLCSQCGLTLAAIALLAGVVRDMRRTRPSDGSWRVEICPACGEVTGVYDDLEGWAMGHRAPVIQELHRTFVAASKPRLDRPSRPASATATALSPRPGWRWSCHNATVSTATISTAPVEVDRPAGEEDVIPARPWMVIVWNDPINLMSYVTFVFQKLFGYSRHKAEKLMLDVHHKGKAVVSHGNRERAEFDVSRLHAHGLWATMQRDS